MWCYIRSESTYLNLRLLVTHPHPEEINENQSFDFQRAKIHFYLSLFFIEYLELYFRNI